MRVAILYITHSRVPLARITLPHLLESLGCDASVHIIDNASTDDTAEWLEGFRSHPVVHEVTRNEENIPLYEVTNRFWDAVSDADYVGKVDDDTLIPVGFFGQAVKTLLNPVKLGAVGAMHFAPSDIDADATFAHNLRRLPNGKQVCLQTHLGGCCYLMRADLPKRFGHISDVGYFRGGWTEYQWMLTKNGYPSCYLYPFMFAKHYDDPSFSESLSSFGASLSSHLPNLTLEQFRKRERDAVSALLMTHSVDALLPRCRKM